jgi:hypothetical protein
MGKGEFLSEQWPVSGEMFARNGDANGKAVNVANILNGQVGKVSSSNFTRPDDATPYDAGDVVGVSPAANLTFSGISEEKGHKFIVAGYRMRIDASAIPAGMSAGFRLHLYSAAPTAIADNAAYNLPEADRAKYLGYITVIGPVKLGDTLWAQDDNINFTGKLADDSTTIYGILETLAAFTPSASIVKTIVLEIMGE